MSPPASSSPDTLFPRPHLVDALRRAQDRRCVVLNAPAGSEKSTLLATWARAARGSRRFVWVDAASRRGLAAALAAACTEAVPSLAALLPARIPAEDDSALTRVAVALVREGARLSRPLVLVFDDLQALREPAVLQGLQPLLDYAPPHLQCIFASRDAPALSLDRLRAGNQLVTLGAQDLRWSQAEAQALFEAWLGDSAPAGAWHAESEGWTLGLTAACRALRAGSRTPQQEALRFLESQVLKEWPAPQRRLLAMLAAVETFDPALAAQLAGRRGADACDLLERFAGTGFLRRPPSADGWWRFHPMMGKLLHGSFFAQETAAFRRGRHRLASAYFAQRGLQLQAVRQAVAAGDAPQAADLVEQWAGTLFQTGRHEELAALVRLVPQPAARRRPSLRLWMALLALLEQRFDDCDATLQSLRRDLPACDARTQRRTRVLQGWLHVHRDDMAAAATAVATRIRVAADVDDITLAGERNVMSWVHIYRNDYERARRLQHPATPTRAPRGTLFGTLTGRCLEGLSLALQGRMGSAERLYREVLAQAEAGGESCADAAVLASGLLGETLYEINDLAGVLTLEPRLAELQRRSLPDPLLRVMLAICRTHAALGHVDEALRVAGELHDYARARQLDRLSAYALLERMRLQLRREDPAAARTTWDEIARLRTLHLRSESTALSEVSMVADRAEIMAHVHFGRPAPAQVCIDVLLATSGRRGRHRRVAALHFQRAAVSRELGDRAAAEAHAMAGLRLGARLGLVRSALDAHEAVPDLLDLIQSEVKSDPLLAFHADRLRAAAGLGPIAAAELGARPAVNDGATPQAVLTAREVQVMRHVALALPNKEIAKALGVSGETVKWHLRTIYGKLGVSTRYQALAALRTAAEPQPLQERQA